VTRRLRCAGSPWRILVHERRTGQDGLRYGRAHDVSNDPAAPARHAETLRKLDELRPDLPPAEDTTTVTVLEGTEFDELVVGWWIHLEQMDTGSWFLNIGGVVVNICADRDGRPKRVDVHGPGDYDDRVPGCRYSLTWSGEEEGGPDEPA
jgi:hypothetical protein